MTESTQADLMKLAGEGVTLEDMIEEAALRLIEYAQEEGITVFSMVTSGRLMGYQDIFQITKL